MSKAFKTLKEIELDLVVKSGLIQQLKLKVEDYKNAYDSVIIANKMLKKEIERLNNIINKIDRLFDVDTHCENIYHAIGVLLKKPYFEIEMIDNEEILDILGVDKDD